MMFDDWSWFWEPWITRLTSISQGVSRLLWVTLLCSYVFVLFFQRWCGDILLAINWFLTILICTCHFAVHYLLQNLFKTLTSGCQDWWFDTTEVCGGTAKQHSVAKIWFRERCRCHPRTRPHVEVVKARPYRQLPDSSHFWLQSWNWRYHKLSSCNHVLLWFYHAFAPAMHSKCWIFFSKQPWP